MILTIPLILAIVAACGFAVTTIMFVLAFVKSKSINDTLRTEYQNSEQNNLLLKQECQGYLLTITDNSSKINNLQQKIDNLHETRLETEKAKSWLESELKSLRDNFEKAKTYEEFIAEKTKASIKEAAIELLEQNKKISTDLLEQNKKSTSEITNDLLTKFADINKGFIEVGKINASISQQISVHDKTINFMKKSFSTASDTGKHGEIILENILQHLGLVNGVDYKTQFHTDNNKRPDCVVFLPDDTIFVIDSKSSSSFVRKSEDETDESYNKKFMDSMYRHLDTLASKDYIKDVTATIEKTSGRQIKHTQLFMFLPSEFSVERIMNLDPYFENKAREKEIFVCSPLGVSHVLSIAKSNINNYAINANYEKIIKEVRTLIESLGRFTERVKTIDSAYKTMGTHIENLTTSLSGRQGILPYSERIKKLLGNNEQIQIKEVITEVSTEKSHQSNNANLF